MKNFVSPSLFPDNIYQLYEIRVMKHAIIAKGEHINESEEVIIVNVTFPFCPLNF